MSTSQYILLCSPAFYFYLICCVSDLVLNVSKRMIRQFCFRHDHFFVLICILSLDRLSGKNVWLIGTLSRISSAHRLTKSTVLHLSYFQCVFWSSERLLELETDVGDIKALRMENCLVRPWNSWNSTTSAGIHHPIEDVIITHNYFINEWNIIGLSCSENVELIP